MKKYLTAMIVSTALLMPGCATIGALYSVGPRLFVSTMATSLRVASVNSLYALEMPFAFAIDIALLPISIPYEIIQKIKGN